MMVTAPRPGRSIRLFSSGSSGTRERSASDLALAIFTLVPTLLLSRIAVPESGFERSVAALFDAVPGALDVLWRLSLVGLGFWCLVVILGAMLQRRWGVVAEIGLSAVLALGLGLLMWQRVNGGWPSIDQVVTGGRGGAVPLMLLAAATSLASASSPHLTKPVRASGRSSVAIGVTSALILGATTPVGATLSVLLGVAAAALVHLGLGTSAGRPTVEQTETALRALNLVVTGLATSPRQSSGVVAMNGVDAAGDQVRVKVYGRDARDAQLLNAIWRRMWYSNDSSFSGSRERQVEHEAFITLLAATSGVTVPSVAVAGMTAEGDAVIAVRDAGRPLSAVEELSRVDAVPQLWRLVRRLHGARIVHGELSLDAFGIVDGAAAVLIGNEAAAKSQNLTPRARIVATALSGADPTIMLTGPVPATKKALARAGMTIDQIDLFEVNEAFAAVPMRFMRELGVPHEKVNVNGGAIAMGHPLGATGAIITGTVLDELERRNLTTALITLCVGAGMGTATIIERV